MNGPCCCCCDTFCWPKSFVPKKLLVMGRIHVRIKGKNLNFYLETHATTHNIYFIWLWILPRNLVHYTGVWMTLKEISRWERGVKTLLGLRPLNMFVLVFKTIKNAYRIYKEWLAIMWLLFLTRRGHLCEDFPFSYYVDDDQITIAIN